MDEFKLLLSEYNRAATAASPNFTDSPSLIPVLLKHGAFTPSRLERWPFALLSHEMNADAAFRDEIVGAFEGLVSGVDRSCSIFVLNEKKAVSLLLAIRDSSFPKLLDDFAPSIRKNSRILLACLEYALNTDANEMRSMLTALPIPCDELDTLAPKFKAKYPNLTAMLSRPSILLAKEALQTVSSESFEEKCILDCAARSLDSKSLYTEIITPTWNTPMAPVILESMRHNEDLKSFCTSINK